MIEFSQSTKKELEEIIKKYPGKRPALMPALYLLQRDFGYISPEGMEYLAKELDLAPTEVYNTASFYSMYFLEPVGKNVIWVCSTLSCALRGSKWVLSYLEEKLGIKVGETTKDGKFTLRKQECLGSCGTAPMMQMNEEYHENLTKEKIDEILNRLS